MRDTLHASRDTLHASRDTNYVRESCRQNDFRIAVVASSSAFIPVYFLIRTVQQYHAEGSS